MSSRLNGTLVKSSNSMAAGIFYEYVHGVL